MFRNCQPENKKGGGGKEKKLTIEFGEPVMVLLGCIYVFELGSYLYLYLYDFDLSEEASGKKEKTKVTNEINLGKTV